MTSLLVAETREAAIGIAVRDAITRKPGVVLNAAHALDVTDDARTLLAQIDAALSHPQGGE